MFGIWEGKREVFGIGFEGVDFQGVGIMGVWVIWHSCVVQKEVFYLLML